MRQGQKTSLIISLVNRARTDTLAQDLSPHENALIAKESNLENLFLIEEITGMLLDGNVGRKDLSLYR